MKQKNKYNIGDVVSALHAAEHGYQTLTIKAFRHNGFTWMYEFKETEMRCGEQYLSKPENR